MLLTLPQGLVSDATDSKYTDMLVSLNKNLVEK